MGSYGIGTSRLVGVIAEKFKDENGIIWPENISPFKVHMISLGDDVKEEAEKLYQKLIESNVEVLWDDREDVRPGEKFNDADLIGIPYRIVVSKKSLENGGFEIKIRGNDEIRYLNFDSLLHEIF
jgi:prolyl-tRNA synthetase